jgi:CHASE2 domain-containing sensor protein
MNPWFKKIITTLLFVVFVAGLVRLAWELLRPAVPTLIALLVVVGIVASIFRRPKQW